MNLKFHNGECTNLKSGDKVHLTACNGFWTVIGVRDHHAVKVQPEDLNDDPIWVDSDEITEKLDACASSEFLPALKDAHKVLLTASKQLSEDHRLVLSGRGWGWKTIAAVEGVIAKAEARA